MAGWWSGLPYLPARRLYNDFGSITRDREANNLNTSNFPEFNNVIDDQGLKDQIIAMPNMNADA